MFHIVCLSLFVYVCRYEEVSVFALTERPKNFLFAFGACPLPRVYYACHWQILSTIFNLRSSVRPPSTLPPVTPILLSQSTIFHGLLFTVTLQSSLVSCSIAMKNRKDYRCCALNISTCLH